MNILAARKYQTPRNGPLTLEQTETRRLAYAIKTTASPSIDFDTAAREMVTELDGYRGLGTPIKLSRTPGGTRRKPPRYGEHGDEWVDASTAAVIESGFSDPVVAAESQTERFSAGGGRGIDRLIDRGRVERFAVTLGAKGANIEFGGVQR